MGIRWCYVVEYEDKACGLVQRERFLFPADAKERREQLMRAGFWGVRYRQQRVHAAGPPTSSNPGIYRHGRAVAGQDFIIKRGTHTR
jgi:hypothetical protein